MSASRYPDSNRYPRERSPPYRDRRPSTFGNGYLPRPSETPRPNPDTGAFPPRETLKGPKSIADPLRGPPSGPGSTAPTAPRDARGRSFSARGDANSLRDAPPLSSGPAAPSHNSHNSWRADRERDGDFQRRERRPTPPRRSPVRESRDARDARDQRDFGPGPRELDVNRARRNSRDGPLSAGSTYPDAPFGGSSYRGSGVARGRGGFAGRGRPFHGDDRDRHSDPRDRPPMDRSYRPRSRSPPARRDRDPRDDRDFDRSHRDDRRFPPREYDSYIGPAGIAKPGSRSLDTHRGSMSSEPRHLPGTPTASTPHLPHHCPSDRLGFQSDSYSRRSFVAADSLSAKDPRREKDEAMLASRAEASKERYAPRASSPPASIPAFGGSNVWRAPVAEVKPTVTPAAPLTKTLPPPPTMPNASSLAVPAAAPAPAPPPTTVPMAPRVTIPPGLTNVPPTGPKADRAVEDPIGETHSHEVKSELPKPRRMEPPSLSLAGPSQVHDMQGPSNPIAKPSSIPQPSALAKSSSMVSTPSPAPNSAMSPPLAPAPKPRAPPTAPQAVLRANASPCMPRAQLASHPSRDASPSAAVSTLGPRIGGGAFASASPLPQSLPVNIPTGPKADRMSTAPRQSPMFGSADRPNFAVPRAPMAGGPKSIQWVRPGLVPSRGSIPTKRELPNEDRERAFGSAPKAPRLDLSTTSPSQRAQQAKSVSPSLSRISSDLEWPKERAVSAERQTAKSPKPAPIDTRRYSDIVMTEPSPRLTRPPMSAASSAPEALQDSDDDLDLDEEDFAESEAKYNRDVARLQASFIDLSASHLRATLPLQEISLLTCLNLDHLPRKTMEPRLADKMISSTAPSTPSCAQPPLDSTTAELPTPQAEDSDDVEMEDKERCTAPATMALRLRRGTSAEQEPLPDVSSLPYLGSGPPTPLSDIGRDRPSLSESVLLALRSQLRKTIDPHPSTEETLRQYAQAYRSWRIRISPWDDERELDDPERQPSVEPTLKVTTPDIQSAAVTGILDGSLASTGRRGHSSRWATELDLEAVLKESLKTAQEERMGKTDNEPRRAMADPEKEADLPLEMKESEAERRRFIDTNFQREPGQGIFVFHYEPPDDDFTAEEHRIMVYNYKDQYAKKWGKLAEVLYKEVGTERTYKDCINHYYATKWAKEYKGKIKGRRGGARKRGGGVARNRSAIANMDRAEVAGEDGLPLPVTETGRPRRSAAPTFGGTETDPDSTVTTPAPGRVRRQTDADTGPEKMDKRRKAVKEKPARKPKAMPLAAAPIGSPTKTDRKEKGLGVKMEEETAKRQLGDLPLPGHASFLEEQEPMLLPSNTQPLSTLPAGIIERPKTQANARPGPSSYWSVSELQDFDKNVAHFGTDWQAIANHMGTKTHTMIKNQFLRLVEGGRTELEQVAREADVRKERNEDLGPPPTPTPAPKRRYESTATASVRQIAPTPEQKSPLLTSMASPKASPPHATLPSRFSTIAQAPTSGKPIAPGYPPLSDTAMGMTPAVPQRQTPPATAQRTQSHHSVPLHKQSHPGPRSGYFTDDLPARLDNRSTLQISSAQQQSRAPQQQGAPQGRPQEHHSSLYRGPSYQERDKVGRSEVQQEQDAQSRYQHHARQISQDMHHHRAFAPGAAQPPIPPPRASSAMRSPEHRASSYPHSRHASQAQPLGPSLADAYPVAHHSLSNAQPLPQRVAIPAPAVKEEPRSNLPLSAPQIQRQSLHMPQQLHTQINHPPVSSTPAPVVAKPPAEPPRKSNLMSLLNDDGPEEPRSKKPSSHGPSSHGNLPQQSAPIAPPPTTQSYASNLRRQPYDEPAATPSSYHRPSYAQQSSLPPASLSRSIDLTHEQNSSARHDPRDSWQARPPYPPSHSQAQPSMSLPSAPASLSQPTYPDARMLASHRSVFAQHNAPRHNPSPPPLPGYSNSPHLQHSTTLSINGASIQPPRAGYPSASVPQSSQGMGASAQVLQPNLYAQVDASGSGAPLPGALGMRPSPHLHTSHLVQSRDATGRSEHSHSVSHGYPNPQTPSETHGHQRSLADPYRRDPRDAHRDLNLRPSDRDSNRELSQRTDYLRDQLSNPTHRPGHSIHDDHLRYPPQDRNYLQRSQTPLSRTEHAVPPLQHPPQSSLGTGSLYGSRPEEPSHRFPQPFPRDRGMADRIREEQAAMSRDEYMRRDAERERERERELRENMLRGRDFRGPLAPPPAGQQDGRMDWTSAVRHAWQR